MKKLIKTSISLVAMLVMLATFSAEASHYRYGSISWRKVDNSTNKVEFKVVTAWRRWSNQTVGTVVSLGSLNFGDGTSAPIRATVTSAQGNSSTGWFFSEALITKTYNANGNYTASFSSCCRIGSPLVNNRNGYMKNETVVNIGNDNNSPVSTVPPIVSLSVGQTAATFKMPVVDPDGDNLTFRLATCSEVIRTGQSCNPNPAGLSVSSDGTITFNTVGKAIGQLYSVMVVAEDGQSKVINDFMFKMVAPSTPPQFDYSTTPADGFVYQVAPGEAVNFNVKAFDVDPGSSVSLSGVDYLLDLLLIQELLEILQQELSLGHLQLVS